MTPVSLGFFVCLAPGWVGPSQIIMSLQHYCRSLTAWCRRPGWLNQVEILCATALTPPAHPILDGCFRVRCPSQDPPWNPPRVDMGGVGLGSTPNCESDPKVLPKRSQTDAKMIRNWCPNYCKMITKWSQSDPKMIPKSNRCQKWSQNDPKIKSMPKWSKMSPNDPKMRLSKVKSAWKELGMRRAGDY